MSKSKVLIIDDRDPNISYYGEWKIEEAISGSMEYNNTLHQSNANGQSLSYTFRGTNITVYGTLDTVTKNWLPGVEFRVDGSMPKPINETGSLTWSLDGTVSHQPLWTSPMLSLDTHTITINITDTSSNGPYFYFDFFTVDTGADSASGYVIVDNWDDSIDYSSGPQGWRPAGVQTEYLNTTAWPLDAGSSAIISFTGTFLLKPDHCLYILGIALLTLSLAIGTEISVFGTTDVGRTHGRAQIGFELDGAQGPIYTDTNPVSFAHNVFFGQTGLKPTNHTLKMTALDNHTWTFDYFVYATNIPSLTAADNGAGGKGAQTPTAAIVGGVLGGLAALALLLFSAYWIMRHKRSSSGHGIHPLSSFSPSPNHDRMINMDRSLNSPVSFRLQPQPQAAPPLHSKMRPHANTSSHPPPQPQSQQVLHPSSLNSSTTNTLSNVLYNETLQYSVPVGVTEVTGRGHPNGDDLVSDASPPPAYSDGRVQGRRFVKPYEPVVTSS
jgi:hypothetical protein